MKAKPRIKPVGWDGFSGWFECVGHLDYGFMASGYGRTHREAYLDWLSNEIPF